MPSKVEALVRNFLRTDGDALYLVPGERIFMIKGTAKAVVGREGLSEESFRAVGAELAPGERIETLVESRRVIPFQVDAASPSVEILFGRSAASLAIMIRRARAAGPSVEPGPGPEPEPEAEPYAAYGTAAPLPPPEAVAPLPPLPPPTAPPGSAPEALDVPDELRSGSVAVGPGEAEPQPAVLTAAPRRVGPRLSRATTSDRPIDDVLMRMLELEASDVHLSSGNSPIFRIHGQMSPQTDMPRLDSKEVERLMNQILSEKHKREFSERNDTDFAYEIEGVCRFRVNMFRDRFGVGAVFRQIPIEVKTAKDLNLPPAIVQLGDLSKGLVLVTGPTGSGKSTTLAAMVDYINETRTDHIITIEDPIEFVHPNKKCLVNQREVGTHTKSFKDALRAALREDPDIVLVGEMRDLETIAIAIETAETGHLVFGTLHTTTATSTVDRIVDQFPADRQQQIRVMLADSLKGVVAQVLCRKIGGGRVAALEVLLTNNAVQNLIRDAKTFQLPSILQTSKAQGMNLLNESLIDFVKRGIVEPREAYLKAVDKLGLLGQYRANNIPLPTESAGEPAAASAPAPGKAAPPLVKKA